MSEKIVCKPTPWFLLRAAAMILMFGIFAALFYKDGRWGYREENLSYYVWQSVNRAAEEFSKTKDKMSPEEWKAYAAEQEVNLPDDMTLLPEGTAAEMKWPEILGDYATMEEGISNPDALLFDQYREQAGLTKDAPDKPFTQRKISEQWIVFWICLVALLVALFILLRTMMRKIVLDGSTFQPAGGKPVDVKDLKRLDLRKWGSKGLAYAWADTGKGDDRKIRIDGLTYGGFRTEDGQPAEKLMKALKSKFSGELVEYEETADKEEESTEQPEETKETSS